LAREWRVGCGLAPRGERREELGVLRLLLGGRYGIGGDHSIGQEVHVVDFGLEL
jgi:hypothetical protein